MSTDGSTGASSKGSTWGEEQTPLGEFGDEKGVTPIPKDHGREPSPGSALLLSCSRSSAGSLGDARGTVLILAWNFPFSLASDEPLLAVFTLSYIW